MSPEWGGITMLGYLDNLLQTTSFLAHGYCLTWRSDLIALHAISDAVIFVSYVVIPAMMLYFVIRRRDLAHKGIFALFAAFILACGATHVISLVTLWSPVYGVEGLIKALTALISLATVIATWFALPKALKLPSPAMLSDANMQLREEVASHGRTNRDLVRVQDQLREHMDQRAREMDAKAIELEQANESLRRFAHIASHDLQEPLRKIASYSDIVEHALRDGDQEEAAQAAERLHAMSTRARTMVADLLRFSKISQYEPARVPIDIAGAIAEVGELYEQALDERGGTLEIDVGQLTAETDPLLMRQILQNIIGNAIKYVPAPVAPHIRVSSRPADGAHLISITDNGTGFDPALTAKIFEPFTRLHGRDVADGSGIGLAIVARAVQSMGWRVSVETGEGTGTTFTLEIPKTDILDQL